MEKRFVASLTETEQQTALASAYQHGEKRALRRRAHAILLSDHGHTIYQISEMLQIRRDAVSRWFKQWEVSGLDGRITSRVVGERQRSMTTITNACKRCWQSILIRFEPCRLVFKKRPASRSLQ